MGSYYYGSILQIGRLSPRVTYLRLHKVGKPDLIPCSVCSFSWLNFASLGIEEGQGQPRRWEVEIKVCRVEPAFTIESMAGVDHALYIVS